MDEEMKKFILSKWLEFHDYEDFYDAFPRFRGAFIYKYGGKPVLKVNMRMGGNLEQEHLRDEYKHLLTDDYMFENFDPSDTTYNHFVYDISDFCPPYIVEELEDLEEWYK